MIEKPLPFSKTMAILDAFSIKGKEIRAGHTKRPATAKAVAAGIREAIRLSEQLIWKKPSRR